LLAIGMALLSAVGFAGAAVTSKRGLAHASTIGGVAISLPAGFLVLVIAVAIAPPPELNWSYVPLLALVGLLGSAIGRFLMIAGLSQLNSTVVMPVQTSTHPLVSVMGAALIVGEPVSLLRIAGVLVMIGGIWAVTRGGGPLGVSEEATSRMDDSVTIPGRLVLLLPIGAGIAYGLSDLTINRAMASFPHPPFGAAVGMFSACVAWGAALSVSRSLRSRVRIGDGRWWFVLQGVLAALSMLLAYAALGSGELSVISPIIATQPVWVLFLSALFMRDVETITAGAIVGTVLAMIGTILVSVS
jgi:drug/metabolite transporter (DMT)-like permease